MRYQMIGIDLDGTLLDGGGEIHPRNLQAIQKAQEQGVRIVPCTGRGWMESTISLEPVKGLSLGVFNTGALVAKVDSGESVDLAMLEPHLAYELVEALKDEPEAVLVYRDRHMAGHDYLVTGHGELTENTQWWFDVTEALVKHQPQVTPDDLHHSLRVGMVSTAARVPHVEKRIKQQFSDRIFCHGFGGIHHAVDPNSIWILEIFAQGVDKWRGLSWVAQRQNIPPEQVAVIGDEVNDLAMVRSAGCGVAMGNAVESVKDVADQVTLENTKGGVGYAIEQMLAGEW